MRTRNIFIIQTIAYSFIPFLLVAIVIFLMELAFYAYGGEAFSWSSWFSTILLFGFHAIFKILVLLFYDLGRVKKLFVDLNNTINHEGSVTSQFVLKLSKQEIIDSLKKNSWKYSIASQEEQEKGTLLKMKYYQLMNNERIQIFIEEKTAQEQLVSITAGNKAKFSLWIRTTWFTIHLNRLKYFVDILTKRQEFSQRLHEQAYVSLPQQNT